MSPEAGLLERPADLETVSINLDRYLDRLARVEGYRQRGWVSQVVGLTIESSGPRATVGQLCTIHPAGDRPPILAEVVGFRDRKTILMPLGEMQGIGPGNTVVAERRGLTAPVGWKLLGRVLDGLGRPMDGLGPLQAEGRYPVHRQPPDPLTRQRVTTPLPLGVRAIDGLLTCGRGQRLGIFAGSGVGKSTLLGMIARNTAADVNVIALIGERGREVRDFLEEDLGPEGLARSVVVVATSDQPALVRTKGAYLATAIAEYFRDQGKDVLLLMDSVTRFAMAQREVGLAVGEPPATKGYTPSVFAELPRLLERSGAGERGTITGLYTVLVDGDDLTDPIADSVRSILDGHVVLSRRLAERDHYPAIDVLASVSRVMREVTGPAQQRAAARVRALLAAYRDAEDLIQVGAYAHGSNPDVDTAIARMDAIDSFLRQGVDERTEFEETLRRLEALAG
ncbi:MAG: flagellar protein export ATPase FliI [Bacillota bacterium]